MGHFTSIQVLAFAVLLSSCYASFFFPLRLPLTSTSTSIYSSSTTTRVPFVAKHQNQTSWRPGIDTMEYTSTYQRQTSQIAQHQEPKVLFPRINKNASDSAAIFGDVKVSPQEHFNTENRIRFSKDASVYNNTFKKTRPAQGFDRETANQTNYSLGMPGEQVSHGSFWTPLLLPPTPDLGRWLL